MVRALVNKFTSFSQVLKWIWEPQWQPVWKLQRYNKKVAGLKAQLTTKCVVLTTDCRPTWQQRARRQLLITFVAMESTECTKNLTLYVMEKTVDLSDKRESSSLKENDWLSINCQLLRSINFKVALIDKCIPICNTESDITWIVTSMVC